MKIAMRLHFVAFLVWASACHMPNLCTFGNGAPCPSGTFCYAGEHAQVGDMGICVHPRTETPPGEETPTPPEPETETEPPAELRVELFPSLIGLSPMRNSATVEVVVSGFKTRADASRLKLDMGLLDKPTWVTLGDGINTPAEDSTHIRFSLEYAGSNFAESSGGTIRLRLGNIPEGYAYNETHNIRVVAGNGQAAHPIPLTQGNILAFNTYANTPAGRTAHYQLMEDVVLPAPAENESNWVPIGSCPASGSADTISFVGRLDGDGHTLSGLVMRGDEERQGFFGCIERGGEIANFGLRDVHVRGAQRVGGLVGANNGSIYNCHVEGSVTLTNTRYASSGNSVGGLVGLNDEYGKVHSSYATGIVRSVSATTVPPPTELHFVGGLLGINFGGDVHSSYATNTVTSTSLGGNHYIGGLVGHNRSANSKAGEVRNSYATGAVSHTNTSTHPDERNYVGGLLGANVHGSVGSSYAMGTVTDTALGTSYAGGLVGMLSLGGSNSGVVERNIALNPYIVSTGDKVGRLVGAQEYSAGHLHNNHARGDMALCEGAEPDGSGGSLKEVEEGNDEVVNGQPIDGVAVDAGQYADVDFWRGVLAEFDTHWEWNDDSQLPTLKGVGGEQNHAVQPPP